MGKEVAGSLDEVTGHTLHKWYHRVVVVLSQTGGAAVKKYG